MNANAASKLGLQPRAPVPETSSEDQGKASAVWIDVDEERPRRRRRARQPGNEPNKPDRPIQSRHQSNAHSDLGRFLPRLGRILEASDPNIRQRSYHDSKPKREVDERNRPSRHKDENDYSHRHSSRRRTSVGSRRPEPLLNVNPSLISLLSSLTGTSERSSGSNSTITQQSYDRKRGLPPRRPAARREKPRAAVQPTPAQMPRTKSPNVFDYMEDVSTVGDHDNVSVISPASSASSHYQPSDAGSSEAPPTPSSRSTLPSPTTTRSVSVAELRRKYDTDHAGSTTFQHGNGHGLDRDSAARGNGNMRKQPASRDTEERNDRKGSASPVLAPATSDFSDSHRQSSQSSLRQLDDEQRLRQQEEELRRHMAYSQHPCGYNFTSPPEISDEQQDTPKVNHDPPYDSQSLEHYIHHPMPTRPTPPKLVRSTASPFIESSPAITSPPHVPSPPDLTKVTLTGYELLASHLSSSTAPPAKDVLSGAANLTPLYRKFSLLHHRVLLHLQDELAELENHLRVLDEGIAQTYAVPPTSTDPSAVSSHHPASRRLERDVASGHPVFARRTLLLGEIYSKQQQYHTALRDYTSLLRDSRPAEDDDVAAYKAFLADRKPICDGEVAFLDKKDDLIVPGSANPVSHDAPNAPVQDALWEQVCFLVALLLLPLLISAVLPDFASRAAATALLGAGAGLVVWGARIRGRAAGGA